MILLWIVAIFTLYFAAIGLGAIIETNTRNHWNHVGEYNES